MAYKGKFKPRNPQKYMGNPTNIIYRSSWEQRVMVYFDRNPNIIGWASEEFSIPYKSPIDGRWHRYYPDFIIKVKEKDNAVRVKVIEVKPKKQTKAPVPQKRITRRYLQEVATYGINRSKWEAAQDYCADRKWEFLVLTEKELGI
jgi:hypothetical protein